MTAQRQMTPEQESLHRYLCQYIDILGAPVLAVYGIKQDGSCSCRKGKGCAKNAGKHPHPQFCPNGVKDATLDKSILADWVAIGGDTLNWGVATGHKMPNGMYLTVLDVDPRNGGEDSLEGMLAEHGELPETAYQLTGGSGYHYLFGMASPPAGTVVAPGLDLKGLGGYIMVEPSKHVSGKTYRWEVVHNFEDSRIGDAPGWIVDGKQKKPRPPWTGKKAIESLIGAAFEAAGWLGHEISEGRHTVCCPWAAQHSDGRGRGGDSSTVILPPSAETSSGGFKCYHEHCASKTWQDVMHALPVDAANAARGRFRLVTDQFVDGRSLVTGDISPEAMAIMREVLLYDRGKDERLKLRKDVVNIVGILKHDPRWQGILTFDSFSNQILVNREPPWHTEDRPNGLEKTYPRQWADEDDLRLGHWITRYWGVTFEPMKCNQAIIVAAQTQSIHPVRDYLRSLEWDGVDRLENWLVNYCGATNNDYTKKAGLWWMISAIARIMEPGCEAHHVLILEGEQGIGKSTVFKILGGKWFTDSALNLGDKDAYQTIRGRWIVELAELDSLSRADASRAKAFFTSPVDTYRPSYGRAVVSVKRQCLFAGTVNHAEYLRDETGNRRYWPVMCARVAYDELSLNRDQLWAEAFKLYESGVKWWPVTQPDKILFAVEVAKREFSDEWEIEIFKWLHGPDALAELNHNGYITVGSILKGLGLTSDKWANSDMVRASRAMQRLKYKKERVDIGGHVTWVFKKWVNA